MLAQDGELLQDQAYYLLDLLVGIELQFAVRPDDVARGRLPQPFAATAPIQPTGLHPLLELVQFEASHEALDRQEHPIVEVMWMIQSVLVGEQGVEGGADLDQPATVLVFTGQAVDLEAEDQADVAQGDLREQPGEIVAADGAGTGAALVAIEDANAFRRPAPRAVHALGDWPGPEPIRGGVGPAGGAIGGHSRSPSARDGGFGSSRAGSRQRNQCDSSGTSLSSLADDLGTWCPIICVRRASRSCWVLGSNCRQLGNAPSSWASCPGARKGGLLRVELWVDALVAILREGQSLLAPACQLQQDRNGYYRPSGRCDKSSCLPQTIPKRQRGFGLVFG